MADQGQWFKLWIGADDDPDLGNLSLEDFGRWCRLGLYIKKHGTNGIVSIKSPALPLQDRFRVSTFDQVVSVLRKFPHCDTQIKNEEMHNSTVSCETMLTVTWHNWAKYQGDFSSHRVRKFREMKRSKRRGEEKRGEEKKNKNKPLINTPFDLIEKYKDHPAYKDQNVETECWKAKAWYEARKQKLTERKFLAWLNRQDKTVSGDQDYKPERRPLT